jgi:hypothetical protein
MKHNKKILEADIIEILKKRMVSNGFNGGGKLYEIEFEKVAKMIIEYIKG